jgi:hypothetical protein
VIGLTKLQSLDLRGIQVTEEGVKKLQAALPKCKIERFVDRRDPNPGELP